MDTGKIDPEQSATFTMEQISLDENVTAVIQRANVKATKMLYVIVISGQSSARKIKVLFVRNGFCPYQLLDTDSTDTL